MSDGKATGLNASEKYDKTFKIGNHTIGGYVGFAEEVNQILNVVMQETYKKNHPGVAVFGDVRDANFAEIKEKYGDIDVVIGGPPCQGFSMANRQRLIDDPRNHLYKSYVEAVKKDITNVEVITASNWADIAKLKAVK